MCQFYFKIVHEWVWCDGGSTSGKSYNSAIDTNTDTDTRGSPTHPPTLNVTGCDVMMQSIIDAQFNIIERLTSYHTIPYCTVMYSSHITHYTLHSLPIHQIIILATDLSNV